MISTIPQSCDETGHRIHVLVPLSYHGPDRDIGAHEIYIAVILSWLMSENVKNKDGLILFQIVKDLL